MNIQFLHNLKNRIPSILDSYSTGLPGWYRLCTEGDYLKPGPNAGVGFSVYAAKIMVQCGLWDHLDADHKQAWIRHIQGFQLPPGPRSHGMFSDPWVNFRAIPLKTYINLRSGRWGDLFKFNWQNRWAETRQAVSTLKAIGAEPLYPITGFPADKQSIIAFLDKLDFSRPWGSCAQVSQLLFLLKNGEFDAVKREEGFRIVLEYLDQLASKETGGWYRGKVENQDIINGAMKILSGLSWWDYNTPNAEALARTTVSYLEDSYDCGVTNRLFVLSRLRHTLGQVVEGADSIVKRSFKAIERFLQPDGGLATQPGGSMKYYYNAPVSKGLPVGDIHGLTLLTWGITLGLDAIDKMNLLGWKLLKA